MGAFTQTKRLLIRTAAMEESYRNAWERIFSAMSAGYFLEAVAIEESIIADRLYSFLSFMGHAKGPANGSLKALIDTWMKQYPGPIVVKHEADLQTAINRWRVDRNSALHGFVKDAPVGQFLEAAQKSAQRGRVLTSYLCEWCAKELRKTHNRDGTIRGAEP